MVNLGGRQPITISAAEVERLASYGLKPVEIAASLGISYCTLRRRRQSVASFERAYQRGRSKGIERTAKRLLQSAQRGDTKAMIFYLRAVAGWQTGEVSVNVAITLEQQVRDHVTTKVRDVIARLHEHIVDPVICRYILGPLAEEAPVNED